MNLGLRRRSFRLAHRRSLVAAATVAVAPTWASMVSVAAASARKLPLRVTLAMEMAALARSAAEPARVTEEPALKAAVPRGRVARAGRMAVVLTASAASLLAAMSMVVRKAMTMNSS